MLGNGGAVAVAPGELPATSNALAASVMLINAAPSTRIRSIEISLSALSKLPNAKRQCKHRAATKLPQIRDKMRVHAAPSLLN
jgi:hypothetical protein